MQRQVQVSTASLEDEEGRKPRFRGSQGPSAATSRPPSAPDSGSLTRLGIASLDASTRYGYRAE